MVIVEDKHSHPSFNTHKKHKQNWNLNLGLLKHKSTWHLAFFFPSWNKQIRKSDPNLNSLNF